MRVKFGQCSPHDQLVVIWQAIHGRLMVGELQEQDRRDLQNQANALRALIPHVTSPWSSSAPLEYDIDWGDDKERA